MSDDIKALIERLSHEITEGSIWTYFGGGNYRVISVELNATSYEETGSPGIVVRYEQLSPGSFPKGQIWVRSIEDFQSSIEKDGQSVPKFSRA